MKFLYDAWQKLHIKWENSRLAVVVLGHFIVYRYCSSTAINEIQVLTKTWSALTTLNQLLMPQPLELKLHSDSANKLIYAIAK